jgi:protein-tyrosine phosphatase
MSHRLLFVCMGNICRSPTAKGLFDHALEQAGVAFVSESAGTHGYHVGHPPDPRAVEAARRAGVDISGDVARQLVADDFRRFDRILVMDRANLEAARSLRPHDATARLQKVMELAPDYGLDEVPDPYYGGEAGFVRVVDMLQVAARALVRELQR